MNGRARSQPAVPHEWIDDQRRFDDFLAVAVSADRVAIDTEFHRERTYWPNVALVQIAVADHIALIDPVAVDLGGLARVLDGPATVVMHAAGQDLEVFHRVCGASPRDLFDTQVAAGFVGLSTPSLSSLVERCTGVRLAKGDRLTDWFTRPLGDAQRTYAASDVAYLFDVHDALLNDLEELGRLEWALDECATVSAPGRPTMPPELAWTRIKEARHLSGRAKAVGATLAEWREIRARSEDIPPRFILSDLALVGVAQRAPRRAEDLRSVRGLDGRFLKDGGAAVILEQVEIGLAMDPKAVPAPPVDRNRNLEQDLRPAVTLVIAWIAQLARDVKLDPALLATRDDVIDFLVDTNQGRLSSGWRNELVGSPIRALVEGRAALAFEGKGRLVLETRVPST